MRNDLKKSDLGSLQPETEPKTLAKKVMKYDRQMKVPWADKCGQSVRKTTVRGSPPKMWTHPNLMAYRGGWKRPPRLGRAAGQ